MEFVIYEVVKVNPTDEEITIKKVENPTYPAVHQMMKITQMDFWTLVKLWWANIPIYTYDLQENGKSQYAECEYVSLFRDDLIKYCGYTQEKVDELTDYEILIHYYSNIKNVELDYKIIIEE